MKILKIKAVKNPSIDIPGTNFAASKITKALITKEKSPKVMIVSGNPKIFKIGVTIRFKTPKTMAIAIRSNNGILDNFILMDIKVGL